MARRKISYERVAELTRLHWSAPKIAEEVGCSPRSVVRIRARLGITQPVPETAGKPISPERMEQARKLAEDGASVGEIRRTVGMHKATITKYFPEARQDPGEWQRLWGGIRNDTKMRRLFDEMGGIT